MAYTKIHAIKTTVDKAIDYICNPDKTDEQIYVSSYACSPETAAIDFKYTLDHCRENSPNKAYHLIQAFAPGEVSYEEAHRIGKELAGKVLEGKYSYVLTTHIDKGHIRNHIAYKKSKNPDAYFRRYESQLILYGGARRVLEQTGINLKGLNVDKLKAEYQELMKQKNDLTSTYKDCEKEVQSLNRKLENLSQYLGQTQPDFTSEQSRKKNNPIL